MELKTIRAIVSGGRNFDDYNHLQEVLDRIHKHTPIDTIISGRARGADSLGEKWAKENNVNILPYPADWNAHGKVAGHLRNQRMIDEGKPDLLIAFPGGKGTSDMVERAKKANIKIIESNADDFNLHDKIVNRMTNQLLEHFDAPTRSEIKDRGQLEDDYSKLEEEAAKQLERDNKEKINDYVINAVSATHDWIRKLAAEPEDNRVGKTNPIRFQPFAKFLTKDLKDGIREYNEARWWKDKLHAAEKIMRIAQLERSATGEVVPKYAGREEDPVLPEANKLYDATHVAARHRSFDALAKAIQADLEDAHSKLSPISAPDWTKVPAEQREILQGLWDGFVMRMVDKDWKGAKDILSKYHQYLSKQHGLQYIPLKKQTMSIINALSSNSKEKVYLRLLEQKSQDPSEIARHLDEIFGDKKNIHITMSGASKNTQPLVNAVNHWGKTKGVKVDLAMPPIEDAAGRPLSSDDAQMQSMSDEMAKADTVINYGGSPEYSTNAEKHALNANKRTYVIHRDEKGKMSRYLIARRGPSKIDNLPSMEDKMDALEGESPQEIFDTIQEDLIPEVSAKADEFNSERTFPEIVEDAIQRAREAWENNQPHTVLQTVNGARQYLEQKLEQSAHNYEGGLDVTQSDPGPIDPSGWPTTRKIIDHLDNIADVVDNHIDNSKAKNWNKFLSVMPEKLKGNSSVSDITSKLKRKDYPGAERSIVELLHKTQMPSEARRALRDLQMDLKPKSMYLSSLGTAHFSDMWKNLWSKYIKQDPAEVLRKISDPNNLADIDKMASDVDFNFDIDKWVAPTDLQNKISGVESKFVTTGDPKALAIAKNIWINLRAIGHKGGQLTAVLSKLPTDSLKRIAQATRHEHEVQDLESPRIVGKGFDSLTPKEREVAEYFQKYFSTLLTALRHTDYKAKGHAGRIALEVPKIFDPWILTSESDKPIASNWKGSALSRSSPYLKFQPTISRGSMLAKRAVEGSPAAELLDNALAWPKVIQSMEKALYSRKVTSKLVENFSRATELNFPRERAANDQWETIDPSLAFLSEQHGLRLKIQVPKPIAEPLKTLFKAQDMNGMVSGLMATKASMENLILLSPIIHNMTIFSKALPYSIRTVGYHYFHGYKLNQDPLFQQKFVKAGGIYANQRKHFWGISEIKNEDTFSPPTLYKKAGKFWHGTLLGDRIADLQASIFENAQRKLMKIGYNEEAAGIIAAHFANLFGGMIAPEDLNPHFRTAMNFILFSHSLTGTNMAIVKELLAGAPDQLKARVERAQGEMQGKNINMYVRRQMAFTLGKDIAFTFLLNGLIQSTVNQYNESQDGNHQGESWAERIKRTFSGTADFAMHDLGHLLAEINEDRSTGNYGNLLSPDYFKRAKIADKTLKDGHPIDAIKNFFPNAYNEPGKEFRIDVGRLDHSQAHEYLKLPLTRLGEELYNFSSDPYSYTTSKLSVPINLAAEAIVGKDHWGNSIADPLGSTADTMSDVFHWLSSQTTSPAIFIPLQRMMANQKMSKLDKDKILGSVLGVSVSKGNSKGPGMGFISVAKQHVEHQFYDHYYHSFREAVQKKNYGLAMTILRKSKFMDDKGRFNVQRARAFLRSQIKQPNAFLTAQSIEDIGTPKLKRQYEGSQISQ